MLYLLLISISIISIIESLILYIKSQEKRLIFFPINFKWKRLIKNLLYQGHLSIIQSIHNVIGDSISKAHIYMFIIPRILSPAGGLTFSRTVCLIDSWKIGSPAVSDYTLFANLYKSFPGGSRINYYFTSLTLFDWKDCTNWKFRVL